MKRNNSFSLMLTICSILISSTGSAYGHGGSFRGHGGGFGYGGRYGGGFALGYGLGSGLGYGYGYGYGPFGGYRGYGYEYPPVIAVPVAPPVYIERSIAPPPQPNFWYYCRNAGAYYPYVRECPGGWEQVAPHP